MKIPIYQIDAFTSQAFGGNPAAVCPLENWIEDGLMQKIASENNLSETAFFVKSGAGYDIRWFTPRMEINLAGHPTLASAFVLYNYLNYRGSSIVFSSKSGELVVNREGDLIKMNFPSTPPMPGNENEIINQGLKRRPLELFKTRDYLAVYENEEDILVIKPDFEVLKKLDCLGIIITAPGKEADFVSRFFAPAAGINEDPVTGSSHTTLIPYWAKRLKKDSLHAYQLSERRGELFCRDLGDRVEIGGRAVAYLEGEINV